MSIYIDTSALIKRYLPEGASDRFEEFLMSVDDEFLISPLGLTEFESTLQRRLRLRDFDHGFLARTRDLFGRDVEGALWSIQPFAPAVIPHATRLIRELRTPLATLDALHQASAQSFGCGSLATADRQLARAAEQCGLVVHEFAG